MRLFGVNIRNFRRIVDGAFFVNGKLTALVGPNEAGKTSIIKALALMSSTEPIDFGLLNRLRSSSSPEEEVVIECDFAITDSDLAVAAKLPLIKPPKFVNVRRSAGGQHVWSFTPPAAWQPAIRADIVAALETLSGSLHDFEPLEGTPDAEEEQLLERANELIDLLAPVRTAVENSSSEDWAQLRSDVAQASEFIPHFDDRALLDKFDAFVQTEGSTRTAAEALLHALEDSQPTFAEFGPDDRDLRFEYNLDEVQGNALPQALQNLLIVADLEFSTLVSALPFPTRRQSLLRKANERLREYFSVVWTQSAQSPTLVLEGHLLNIYVQEFDEEGAVVDVSERSDGLRLYLALSLFLESRRFRSDLVLLIDEAELHLHYDAQADLINSLSQSEFVTKVIYTTHSPGCLPRDLGTGVRFVEPDPTNGSLSRVRQDFWNLGAGSTGGFSPLLLAMGASAATFAHVRQAVVTEGASEMLLLPTLIRAAVGLSELPALRS